MKSETTIAQGPAAQEIGTQNGTAEAYAPQESVTREDAAKELALLELVPLGDDALDSNTFAPISPDNVVKMIENYKTKRSKPDLAGKRKLVPVNDPRSCWLCIEAVLKLLELDEKLENELKEALEEKEISGIRIYKGLSDESETHNFILLTTSEQEAEQDQGEPVHYDRMEGRNRVLYVDTDTHSDPYGGSLCPPTCSGGNRRTT